VRAEERNELSLPAAGGGLKTMGYARMAMHRPGGVLPGGHSPSTSAEVFHLRGHELFRKRDIVNNIHPWIMAVRTHASPNFF
jgi:hypothetical protein